MNKIQDYDFALGFRGWEARDGYLLAHRGDIWIPGEVEAKCDRIIWGYSRHTPADRDCACGWHCFNRIDDAYNYVHPSAYNKHVVGAILGWGKIQFHANGFRSQFAMPLALIDKRFVRVEKFKFNRPGFAKIFPRIKKQYANNIYENLANKYNIPRLNIPEFNLYLQEVQAQNKIFVANIDNVLEAPVLVSGGIRLQVPRPWRELDMRAGQKKAEL